MTTQFDHPYTENSLANLMSAATRMDATAFGLVIKVRGNTVLNWMYADSAALRTIAAQHGEVTYRFPDSKNFSGTLRELALSLAESTPFVALMIRYKGRDPEASSWEFIDLDFIKTITQKRKHG